MMSGSEIAKGGYENEVFVCQELNNNSELRTKFEPIVDKYGTCRKINGVGKCDIASDDKIMTAQVKKFKSGCFQQLDRHWVGDLVSCIPGLYSIQPILKDLFELPLLPNGTHVDKTAPRKKLSTSNYEQTQLNGFLDLLNNYKQQILEFAFYGKNRSELTPKYLIGVECGKDNKQKGIVLFKIQDIINYLVNLDFEISSQKTCVLLGRKGPLSIQRKGGDSGMKSSNQLQIKLTLSKLIGKVECLEYKFINL
tara:strand:+ start:5017 stop:5772 length:756 start_codon:yes stop_codon:yes gene_type:complete